MLLDVTYNFSYSKRTGDFIMSELGKEESIILHCVLNTFSGFGNLADLNVYFALKNAE